MAMDSDLKGTASAAHPDSMDLLSRAWCDFAVQNYQPEFQEKALILQDSAIKMFEGDTKSSFSKMQSVKMEDSDRSIPAWKSNDVKSWIWMQQAMHPELNYNSWFRKKWFQWKISPLKHVPIKKWLKEMKQKRKEGQRLQRAEVHAAISVAGVAAVLASIAAENSKQNGSSTAKDSAVASAAALVAAQCAQVAEGMGAKREQLRTVIGSAMSATSAGDILTLTAAATTSLRGASTLKERSGCKNRLNGVAPVLSIEENRDSEFDFGVCRSVLAKGTKLSIETSDGRCMLRSVSIILTDHSKVVLKVKKLQLLNAFPSKKESIVLDLHAELYKDSEAGENETGYLIVLITNHGVIKLDMMDDYQRYKMWTATINHMLLFSTSISKYGLGSYKT